MRKISILLIGLVALFATGCAEESTDVKSDDIYVTSFYDMGCGDSFGNINLGKNNSVTGQYPNEQMVQLRCNSDVSVRIDFYDEDPRLHPGHHRYFLVNNTPVTYYETIYVDSTGESSGVYTFTTDPSIEQYGTYYGKYTVTALNLETRKYTVQEYRITAFENGPYSKEAAVSKFEARKAPELPAKSEEAKADNTASNNAAAEEAK